MVIKNGETFQSEATGSAFGTCGELVQGCFNDQNFMITFPIDLWTHADIRSVPGGGVKVFPEKKSKASKAAAMLLHSLRQWGVVGNDFGVEISIRSSIPESKGMASSTADIVASVRAVAKLCNYPILPWEIAKIAASIEPSDAVMYDNPVAFDFFKGELLEDFGKWKPMKLLVFDCGGEINTLNFQRKAYTSDEMKTISEAYALAARGIREGDIEAVGRAATLSTMVNQRRHFKEQFEQLELLCPELGAHGIGVAHSGTILSVLFDANDHQKIDMALETLSAMYPTSAMQVLNTISEQTPVLR